MDSVHLDAPGQRQGQQSVSGTADSTVVKQDKSSRGSVDTTIASTDPQGRNARWRIAEGYRLYPHAAHARREDTELWVCKSQMDVSLIPLRGSLGLRDGPLGTSAPSVAPACSLLGIVCYAGESDCFIEIQLCVGTCWLFCRLGLESSSAQTPTPPHPTTLKSGTQVRRGVG